MELVDVSVWSWRVLVSVELEGVSESGELEGVSMWSWRVLFSLESWKVLVSLWSWRVLVCGVGGC